MGRDQLRVLACAAASIVLIVAATLFMDWYRVSFGALVAALPMKATIDLRSAHICASSVAVCSSMPLSIIAGMYPTMSTATLWSGLGFAAVVGFQAASHLLTGNANESLGKLGYVFGLIAIAIAVSTAYMFGLEADDPGFAAIAQAGGSLHRTWAPATLLAGLVAGFAALYSAIAHEWSDPAAEYKPVTPAFAGNTPAARLVSGPLPSNAGGAPRAARPSSLPLTTAPPPMDQPLPTGPLPRTHAPTGPLPRTAPPTTGRLSPIASTTGPITRGRSASIPIIPEHLRNRLSYVAITAELTGGGIDARREDGSSRLVLWRDVVGAVVRRMPSVYSSTVFVDIISTAGSTLRIVPWTRLTGESIGDNDRARGVVQHILMMAPGARLDAATRQFLDTGEIAQLPDLETLQAHDARLA